MQGKFLHNGNFSAAKGVAGAASVAQFAKVVFCQIVMTPKGIRGFSETLLKMQDVRGEGEPHVIVN